VAVKKYKCLDTAARRLIEVAKESGCDRVAMFVHLDGRISLSGSAEGRNKWLRRSDLRRGAVYREPSVEIGMVPIDQETKRCP
jgi:hypothetical protein